MSIHVQVPVNIITSALMLVKIARSFFPRRVKTARPPTVSPKVIKAAAWTQRKGFEIALVSC